MHIRDFSALAFIGIKEVEKLCRQKVVVNIEIALPDKSDGETPPRIDYDEVCEALREVFREEKFGLLEQLASRLGSLLEERFGTRRYTVSCAKPNIFPDVESVEVVLKRQ